ncbi:MAG: MFS transporter, partial [Gammaproteobacteria bacterium]
IAISFVAVFALRGVYFALLEHSRVPAVRTGTAVGLVSMIGYTPDIFFAPIAGRLLDATPGLGGHQHYFVLLATIALGGLSTTLLLGRFIERRRQENPHP